MEGMGYIKSGQLWTWGEGFNLNVDIHFRHFLSITYFVLVAPCLLISILFFRVWQTLTKSMYVHIYC